MVVVYFSRAGENYGVGNVKVGNTAKLAEAITEETDAPLIEITRNEPYPEGYDEATSVAQDERRDNAARKSRSTATPMPWNRPAPYSSVTQSGGAMRRCRYTRSSKDAIGRARPSIRSARTKVAVWDRPQTTSLTPPAQS